MLHVDVRTCGDFMWLMDAESRMFGAKINAFHRRKTAQHVCTEKEGIYTDAGEPVRRRHLLFFTNDIQPAHLEKHCQEHGT